MNRRRIKSGFTLAEVLVVVGIVAILMGVAFIAVPGYLRSTAQVEYDTVAREIFVAAQNHLTLAHSQGYPGLAEPVAPAAGDPAAAGASTESPFGEEDQPSIGTTYNKGDYHIIVNMVNGKATLAVPELTGDSLSILDLMLPEGAIDGTISRGNYIIRYNKDAGVVKDVFYSGAADTSGFNLSGRYAHTFTKDDYTNLVPAYCDEDTHKNWSVGGARKVLGWYGGAMAENLPTISVKAPSVEVENGDRLLVRVTSGETIDDSASTAKDLKIRLTVTGKLSGNTKTFLMETAISPKLPNLQKYEPKTIEGKTYAYYEIVLDSVTENGLHFADLCAGTDLAVGKKLFPGEDIEIEAFCFSSTNLGPVMSSGKRTTNSLFGDNTEFSKDTGKTNEITGANIASIRHLENMAPSISGIKTAKEGTNNNPILNAAKQSTNLSWSDFAGTINSTKPEEVKVLPPASSTATSPYIPVKAEKAVTYDGQNHSITGITATDADKDAGLFAELKTGSEVKNLNLIDFTVSGGNAGALAGKADGSTISNVLARNTRHKAEDTVKNDAAYEITGTTSAGGLVGSVTGGKVENSAAAVYVKATGAAGGLIGTLQDGTVEYSYSGGHTSKGAYALNADGTPVTADNTAGRVNVTGANAGGLIGSIAHDSAGTAPSVKSCYSTCSVSGSATAGGFVGSGTGASITNCYCTGLVVGSAATDTLVDNKNGYTASGNVSYTGTKHAFLGSGNAVVSNCYYYSIINDEYYASLVRKETDKATQKTMPTILAPVPSWNGTGTGVQAFDAAGTKNDAAATDNGASLDAVGMYNWFCFGSYDSTSGDNATGAYSQPYDPQLTAEYYGRFFIRSIAELAKLEGDASAFTMPTSGGDHLKNHYGDWPEPEIFIINSKSA